MPAGSAEGGRWTDGGGGGSAPDGTAVDLAAEAAKEIVDLSVEEAVGGHTIARHVGKTEEYLRARVDGSRINIPLIGSVGEKRAGSFFSIASANKLVSSTISQNSDKIDAFVQGKMNILNSNHLWVHADFTKETGYEAYTDGRRKTEIRDTYGVTVHLRRDRSQERGYFVLSAWPTNRD